MEGDLLSSSAQVRSRSGLVQVWFSLELKFNSFELDSEVGRLVWSSFRRKDILYILRGELLIADLLFIIFYKVHISPLDKTDKRREKYVFISISNI